MDFATELSPASPKRHRSEEADELPPSASAYERAKFAVKVTLASLPPTITSLAEEFHTKFLSLRIELRRLDLTKARLAKEDFVPNSTRIKFELGATTRVKESAAAEYTTLVAQTEIQVALFKAELKKQIVQLVELEIETAKTALRTLFCKSVAALAITVAIDHPTVDHTCASDLVAHTFERHHDSLLRHSEFSGP